MRSLTTGSDEHRSWGANTHMVSTSTSGSEKSQTLRKRDVCFEYALP
jgi:hypothetical protein